MLNVDVKMRNIVLFYAFLFSQILVAAPRHNSNPVSANSLDRPGMPTRLNWAELATEIGNPRVKWVQQTLSTDSAEREEGLLKLWEEIKPVGEGILSDEVKQAFESLKSGAADSQNGDLLLLKLGSRNQAISQTLLRTIWEELHQSDTPEEKEKLARELLDVLGFDGLRKLKKEKTSWKKSQELVRDLLERFPGEAAERDSVSAVLVKAMNWKLGIKNENRLNEENENTNGRRDGLLDSNRNPVDPSNPTPGGFNRNNPLELDERDDQFERIQERLEKLDKKIDERTAQQAPRSSSSNMSRPFQQRAPIQMPSIQPQIGNRGGPSDDDDFYPMRPGIPPMPQYPMPPPIQNGGGNIDPNLLRAMMFQPTTPRPDPTPQIIDMIGRASEARMAANMAEYTKLMMGLQRGPLPARQGLTVNGAPGYLSRSPIARGPYLAKGSLAKASRTKKKSVRLPKPSVIRGPRR